MNSLEKYFDGFDDAIDFVRVLFCSDWSRYEKYFDSKRDGINLVHFLEKHDDIREKLSDIIVDMLKRECEKLKAYCDEKEGVQDEQDT